MRFLLMCTCLTAIVLLASPAVDKSPVVEEIIAKVNSDIITRSEMDRDRRGLENELRSRGVAAPALQNDVAERSKDILRERIDSILLVGKAKELNISVESEVSKYIAELQVNSKISDAEKFQAYVREQTGQSYEDYRNEVRNGILRQRVIREQVGRGINIPRTELQKYYEEHKNEFMREESVFLREIFLSTEGKDPAATAAVEKKAKDVAARARKGERFTELAKANSDSVTKEQYGELGAFKKGELDKSIENLVWTQERGFVSEPLKRSNGYLILRVDDRHKAGQAALEEVENEIMEKLYMPKFQPKIREYLTQLRQEAFLEIKSGYVDSGAAPGKNTTWTDPAQLKPETVTKEEVASRKRRKKLLWAVPIPGTSKSPERPGVSTSK
ncbi:MAG: peptidylprolyl isomerase [Bryobacteraceae bacterium]|nr:peptidylprolyl isomerase [Bryobacteraceae bacterium]